MNKFRLTSVCSVIFLIYGWWASTKSGYLYLPNDLTPSQFNFVAHYQQGFLMMIQGLGVYLVIIFGIFSYPWPEDKRRNAFIDELMDE